MEDVPRECKRFGGPRGWVFKQRFDTRQDAVLANRDIAQVPYRCWYCSFWHLGHEARVSA